MLTLEQSPTWTALNTVWDGFRVSVGEYPVNAEFGNNTTAIPQAVAGLINIPSTATGNNHGAGVAGYALTSAPSIGAVGVFGFGGINSPNAASWGGNFLVTN